MASLHCTAPEFQAQVSVILTGPSSSRLEKAELCGKCWACGGCLKPGRSPRKFEPFFLFALARCFYPTVVLSVSSLSFCVPVLVVFYDYLFLHAKSCIDRLSAVSLELRLLGAIILQVVYCAIYSYLELFTTIYKRESHKLRWGYLGTKVRVTVSVA